MKKSCNLCGEAVSTGKLKRMYTGSKHTNLITLASLSLIGVVERDNVDTVLGQISKSSSRVCYSHIKQAAQYLCAEIAARGMQHSYGKGPTAGGTPAYVSTSDIPQNLIDVINGMTKTNVVISARDVRSYVNLALKKFEADSLWPEHCPDEVELEKPPPMVESMESTAPPELLIKAEVELEDDFGMIEKPEENYDVAATPDTKVW
ncbi:hypothetical protein COOONC_02188 [Cooperia oncophora]